MVHALNVECRKLIGSTSFFAAVLFVAALCMTAVVYMDPSSGKSHTVLEVLGANKQNIRNGLIAAEVFRSGLTNQYAQLFLPIAVGLGFVPQHCQERTCGQLRLQVIRQGKIRYTLGKIISAMLCGGLIVLIGFLLYGGIVMLLFSCSSTPETIEGISQTVPLWRILCGKFTQGMAAAVLPLLLCVWLNDPYPILCIPVLYLFLVMTVHNTLSQPAYPVLSEITRYMMLSGGAMLWVQFSWVGLTVVLSLPLLTATLFTVHICRKEDCGA